ncbi:hypothetical protein ACFQX6_57245 [Streptosporangium lutulentum]
MLVLGLAPDHVRVQQQDRRRAGDVMRALVDGDPPPGLLAYVDGEVAAGATWDPARRWTA